MSDADQQKPGAQTEGQDPQGEVISRYEVVPYKEIAKDDELYSFRAAMPQFLPARAPGQAQPAAQTAAPAAPPAAQPPAQSAPAGKAAPAGQAAQAGQIPAQAPAQAVPPAQSAQPSPSAAPAQAGQIRQAPPLIPPGPPPLIEIPPPPKPPLDQKKLILFAGCGGIAVMLVGLLIYMAINKQDPIAPFVDLGQTNVASAGLAGRLIAKWDGAAQYELHIDPLSPQQAPGFAAVAVNPPRPLTIALRITSDSGSLLCQKEIVLPFNPVQDPDDALAQEFQPQKTFDGDTVQNVAGPDGQVEEILMSGPLTCPAKTYRAFATWQFTSSFPSVAEQQDWLRQQDALMEQLRRKSAQARANANIPRGLHLASPVDGDDVIVSDNPSHGTVATRAGRTFYIGRSGEMARAGWEVFPAVIHFHCDVKSSCVLTRPDTSTSITARLVH
jgi:hypothetical protein